MRYRVILVTMVTAVPILIVGGGRAMAQSPPSPPVATWERSGETGVALQFQQDKFSCMQAASPDLGPLLASPVSGSVGVPTGHSVALDFMRARDYTYIPLFNQCMRAKGWILKDHQ